MKILHVTECTGGGVLRAAVMAARAAPEHTHVLCSPLTADQAPDDFDEVRTLPESLVARILAVRREVRSIAPDVVFAHSSWAGIYTRALPSPVPIVYQPHCYVFEDPARPAALRVAYRLVETALAPRSTVTVALTPHEAALARSTGAVDVEHVPNAATVSRPASSGAGELAPRRTVVMVGRISPQKDPGLFAEIARRTRALDPSITFRWIGDGDAEQRNELEAAGVQVTGWVGDADLVDLLGGAALYVHTAAYEGFPLSVLDAAALRVPTVVRAIAATAHTRLASFDDAAQAVHIIRRALDDPDARATILALTCELEESMNPEEHRESLARTYDQAVSAARRPGTPGRPRRAIILHGYSAANRGDGLLVELALDIVRSALGEDVEITVAANHPDSFHGMGVRVLDSGLRRTGYRRAYLKTLRHLGDFDLVVGVGGGYLRFGHLVESLKAGLIHGPQLFAAARTKAPTVYLPQSIGPLRLGSRPAMRRLLRSVDVVFARDDRTVAELALPNVVRTSDLALGEITSDGRDAARLTPDAAPILSVRHVDGGIPAPLADLARRMGTFDGYVQSTAGKNDDRPAMASMHPRTTLGFDDLMVPSDDGGVRVIVAVRMHAALMALKAGHYVIHLSYERKGFAAFADLGLAEFVHNVRRFDPALVQRQVTALLEDEDERRRYDALLVGATSQYASRSAEVASAVAALVPATVVAP
ncbi:polysaccharide pyruvyl transferase family protein [Sanguibacter antarcticus]|uniref:Glycosyltransferase involved in cell wall biosynthesis n=1 Tax=Sanguibacter antarcticus TaxID=372484 RepID=A0A2A9E497_9MICO|nr:polysaccharide pyruvyl transferase family protein [Sanguibacter antarcticus]PFG33185.1 glycosyltransferase involved in cell wall biosynthesis [Sanguibacter antarcticus]